MVDLEEFWIDRYIVHSVGIDSKAVRISLGCKERWAFD